MDIDFLPVYILVMKIIGALTSTVGFITLYLIVYHSAKIGKLYKVALILHHSL